MTITQMYREYTMVLTNNQIKKQKYMNIQNFACRAAVNTVTLVE